MTDPCGLPWCGDFPEPLIKPDIPSVSFSTSQATSSSLTSASVTVTQPPITLSTEIRSVYIVIETSNVIVTPEPNEPKTTLKTLHADVTTVTTIVPPTDATNSNFTSDIQATNSALSTTSEHSGIVSLSVGSKPKYGVQQTANHNWGDWICDHPGEFVAIVVSSILVIVMTCWLACSYYRYRHICSPRCRSKLQESTHYCILPVLGFKNLFINGCRDFGFRIISIQHILTNI